MAEIYETLFDNINENNPDEAMIELEEVFHTD
ncbi:MAG: hypothetical protein Ct9H90mP22_0830 [Gammaproteobacteria bacterium]|nr:MAG: hypothetical protein Ct9H90mP22_0830 [Gammaproteobacteria bacterium]